MKLAMVVAKDMGLAAMDVVRQLGSAGQVGCIAIDDRSDPRSTFDQVKAMCESHGITFGLAVDSASVSQLVRTWKAECALSVGWHWSPSVAELQQMECPAVVARSAPLPRYRGAAPLVWMILNGETEGGASLMWADGSLDEGDLLDQQSFALAPDATIYDAVSEAWDAIQTMLIRSVPKLLAGERPRFPQSNHEPVIGMPRSDDDSWIDWERSAQEIFRLVRALTRPYPGARFRTDTGEGRVFRVASAGFVHGALPGLVVAGGPKPVVACGDGYGLTFLEFEAEGFRDGVRLRGSQG